MHSPGVAGRPTGSEVPELKALRRLRSKCATQKTTAREVQEALAPYWKAWREEPKKATVVLRRLAEEKVPLALLVLDCMKRSTVETNIRHWNPVIFELSKTHEWQHSVELLLSVMRSQVPPDIQSFSSICNAASRADAWLLALRVLQDMPRMQVQPNERIYNIVASCCSSHWQIAKTLLDDMMICGILPDAITFSTVAACSPSVMTWCMTLGLLEMGGRQKVEMDVTNYGATINGLEDSHWLEVMVLLGNLLHLSLEVSLQTFNAAVGMVISRPCCLLHQICTFLFLLVLWLYWEHLTALAKPLILRLLQDAFLCAKVGLGPVSS